MVKVFLDSNILIYCYTSTEPIKQQKAFQVIDQHPHLFVSLQVLQEFCNVVHKKFSPQEVDLATALLEIESMVSIHNNNIDTVRKANVIKNKYGYSSMLLWQIQLANNKLVTPKLSLIFEEVSLLGECLRLRRFK